MAAFRRYATAREHRAGAWVAYATVLHEIEEAIGRMEGYTKKAAFEEAAAKEVAESEAALAKKGSDDVAVTRVRSKLQSMLEGLEADIAKVDEAIGEKLHVLDVDDDGILTEDEMTSVLQTMLKTKLTEEEATRKVRKLMEEVDKDGDGLVSVEELRMWLAEEKRKDER